MNAMNRRGEITQNHADSRDIGNLDRAAAARRQADWSLSMSERLARVHGLCKQMSAIKGAAHSR
jgi:hypothetical protein